MDDHRCWDGMGWDRLSLPFPEKGLQRGKSQRISNASMHPRSERKKRKEWIFLHPWWVSGWITCLPSFLPSFFLPSSSFPSPDSGTGSEEERKKNKREKRTDGEEEEGGEDPELEERPDRSGDSVFLSFFRFCFFFFSFPFRCFLGFRLFSRKSEDKRNE